LEKAQKSAKVAKQLQEFHRSQMVERKARDKAERNDECNYTKTNMNLLKVQSWKNKFLHSKIDYYDNKNIAILLYTD
jgi:hypothetical protein